MYTHTYIQRESAHIFCILYSEDKRLFIEHMGDFDKLFVLGLNFFS